jgi:hypothetical protein
MEAKGFVVPPGQGRVWKMAAGRSSALKLLGGETGESVMMFEETAPSGTLMLRLLVPSPTQPCRAGSPSPARRERGFDRILGSPSPALRERVLSEAKQVRVPPLAIVRAQRRF